MILGGESEVRRVDIGKGRVGTERGLYGRTKRNVTRRTWEEGSTVEE